MPTSVLVLKGTSSYTVIWMQKWHDEKKFPLAPIDAFARMKSAAACLSWTIISNCQNFEKLCEKYRGKRQIECFSIDYYA